MKNLLCLLLFIVLNSLAECLQPYFPDQIVFSPDNGVTTIAIDKPNERAYNLIKLSSWASETSYVYQHFPFAVPGSPQSKYYVQLLIDYPPLNYEDYWYANETCRVDSGATFSCEEIFFKKNTDIPLRSTRVIRGGWAIIQITINYQVISMGQPDEKYFDSIPKNWSLACRDVVLGLLYYPQTTKIDLDKSEKVQIWLPTPPHHINGNDTTIIQWKSQDCPTCFSTSPKELIFNTENFQERQTLTITRVKDGPKATLIPIFNGDGFDLVTPDIYPIHIE